jgi:hypothetical protein
MENMIVFIALSLHLPLVIFRRHIRGHSIVQYQHPLCCKPSEYWNPAWIATKLFRCNSTGESVNDREHRPPWLVYCE